MSLAVTLGTIVALGIAAIVAFCVICFGMLATGNLNMH
jgi:hypothetical protein